MGKYSPQGDSPYGLADMAGNVWEWTCTLYKEYPYNPDDGRNDPAAEGQRVLRGGSWHFNLRLARCTCRFNFDPDLFDYGFGFRVVAAGGK